METILDPAILAGLVTLILLEVVLGIDNLVFIAILADKLPPEQRDKARLLGLSLALFMRLGLLASIAWIVGLTAPVFELFGKSFSWRDVILIGGGLFLLAKATKEIHERLEGDVAHSTTGAAQATFGIVIAQILVIDAVFSLDSIITAVGMVDELWVMMTAVIIAMIIMIAASKPLTTFVGKHPTVIMLCLSFLLLIGCSLIAEGVGFYIPKGYLYAAMGFSVLIEVFNQFRTRNREKAQASIPFRQRTTDNILRLLSPQSPQGNTPDNLERDEINEVFQPSEHAMIKGVIDLADKPVRSIMTARSDIFWLDSSQSADVNHERLVQSGRTRVLIADGSLDSLTGVAETRELLLMLHNATDADFSTIARQPLVVLDDISALRLTDVLRETGERFAVVVDGNGTIDGVVTSTDIFAAIAGDLAEDENDGLQVQNEDGSFDLSASILLGDLSQIIAGAPVENSERYTSLGGYLLHEFGRMPYVGEKIAKAGITYTVQVASTNRIERVNVKPIPAA